MTARDGPAGLPPLLHAYRLAATVLAPAAPLLLRRRLARGKEDPERWPERLGRPSRPRPAGPLVWMHGASIGETTALLGLAERIGRRGLAVLMTSGTRTSAEVLARRLPAGACHQYLPLDSPPFVERFLRHWRPDLAVFAESEIWPNCILALARRRVPLVLANARLSERSGARWARRPAVARALFGRVRLCLAQSEADAARFSAAGAPDVAATGNLKFDASVLPADPAAAERLAGRLAGRPVWMAASTHPGEEETVLAAHRRLLARWPGLALILAPRHPERAASLDALARSLGLAAARGRDGDGPPPDVLVVDRVGELGLYYRVAPVVLMGGSLVPHGGQNPIEPARLGAAILHGPHVANFLDVYAALASGNGSVPVAGADDLAAALDALLGDPARLRDTARAGAAAVTRLGGALDRTMRALEPLLPAGPARPRGPAGP